MAGTTYLDLYLVHWPGIGGPTGRRRVWAAMEDLHRRGVCRAIGVSNFLQEASSMLLASLFFRLDFTMLNEVLYVVSKPSVLAAFGRPARTLQRQARGQPGRYRGIRLARTSARNGKTSPPADMRAHSD